MFRRIIKRLASRSAQVLMISFLCVSALLVFACSTSIWQIVQMGKRAQRLYQADRPVAAMLLVRSDFDQYQSKMEVLAETQDPAQFIRGTSALRITFNSDIDRATRSFLALSPGPERDRQLIELESVRSMFNTEIDDLTNLANANDWDEVLIRTQGRWEVIASFSEVLAQDIDKLAGQEKGQDLEDIRHAGRRAIATIILVSLSVMLIVALLGWAVTRMIAGRLEQLDAAAHAIARGEFAHRVTVEGNDEIARLSQVFNEMAARLSDSYEALLQRGSHFRSLIENASDFILQLDAAGTVTYASPSFERHFGLDHDQLMGRRLVDIVVPADRQILVDGLARVLTQSLPETMQFRMEQSPGKARTFEGSVVNLLKHPNVNGLVMNARDITERQSLEAQLARAQKLEAIGNLSGGIAHDFNNLLTVILGYTGQLLDQKDQVPDAHRKLQRVDEAAKRAASLTRQLLAFSRQQAMQPKVVNLNNLVRNLEPMLRRLIREDVRIVTEIEPSIAPIKVDPTQVEQILMNLVVNARDAMSNGGEIRIHTANVVLDEDYVHNHLGSAPGPHVMLTVSDSGMGISPENMPHIFEPFFTTKEIGKGTGLGLATVYGIVHQSGGHVWVYSEVGIGTVFKVYFPAVTGSFEAPAAPAPVPKMRGSETILLVEDEPTLRELITNVLTTAGYKVLSTHEPGEAISTTKKYQGVIHMLLTDVIMPTMNGAQLALALRKDLPNMKVLYMSGYTTDFTAQHGIIGPGSHFLEKPFRPTILLQRIREVLGG